MGRIYSASFMRTLRRKAIWVTEKFAGQTTLDRQRISRTRTMIEFDEAATAPLHGFTGAEDYYERSSSIRYISRIAVPTLCISAIDDPFLPRDVLSAVRKAASDSMDFVITERGGHVGFVGGTTPWQSRYWAEEFAVNRVVDSVAGPVRERAPEPQRSELSTT